MRILMGTYALSAGYYDAYYKRAQQVTAQQCRPLQISHLDNLPINMQIYGSSE
jgi:Asp-tRNA(Asn)/Glu-tRNA(Gln) amidotransferase A subunit family amidase